MDGSNTVVKVADAGSQHFEVPTKCRRGSQVCEPNSIFKHLRFAPRRRGLKCLSKRMATLGESNPQIPRYRRRSRKPRPKARWMSALRLRRNSSRRLSEWSRRKFHPVCRRISLAEVELSEVELAEVEHPLGTTHHIRQGEGGEQGHP